MLVSNGLESDLHQRIRSVGHRHHDDRHDTGQASVPRRTLLVFTMTPHTSRLLVLTHSDATNPIPSAAQHPKSTYWYLQAIPELLALAAVRLESTAFGELS